MKHHGRILAVDDNREVLLALGILLEQRFSRVDTLADPNRIPEYISKAHYDVVILDMNFKAGAGTGNEGIYWMNQIFQQDAQTSVVFITAYGDIDLAVKAIKEGATDFIQKPWDDEKLLTTIHNAWRLSVSNRQIRHLKDQQRHLSSSVFRDHPGLIGDSPALRNIQQTLKKVAPTDTNVLILGESGVGKEVVARELHRLSKRKDHIFVHLDLASIPGGLFESELFGHEKGAFTDAITSRTGRFELASGGTLFLDEIGNLPLSLQHKLLMVIQNREITRVGNAIPLPVDIRLVSATNTDPYEMIRQGTFRQDLLYRINTIEIEVPPLRERKEDIIPIAEYLGGEFGEKYGRGTVRFTSGALKKLQQYEWPGNVRELRHTLEKAVILREKDTIGESDLLLSSRHQSQEHTGGYNLEEHEKKLIGGAIRKHEGNLSRAVKELGISRKTLYNKMKKYGI